MSQRGFRDLGLTNFHHGPGEVILQNFVLPVLASSKSYDRLTGYFNIPGLVGISSGLEELFRNTGTMRLVIGLHDVPGDLLASLAVGDILPEDVIQTYRDRLIQDIGFLKSETEKSCLVAVAWLIRLGYLQVVVAAPRTTAGIFHQKRMIFCDTQGDVIAGTGSLNETQGGMGNSEEMYFQFSWQTVESAWKPFVDDFENIWNNISADVIVRPLDSVFASEILAQLGDPPSPFDILSIPTPTTPQNDSMGALVDFAQSSLSLAALNSSTAVLYPHQERVFIDALRDFPVRKLLGDEVGLGKTLEAGAIISHLVKTSQVQNVVILAPAGLMNQWQQEMSMHFNLEFWKWDSTMRNYVDATGLPRQVDSSTGQAAPMLRIISAQWARLHAGSLASLRIDLLVVDEAHAARLHRDAYGTRRTKLWKLLKDLLENVPHVLLLTATPLQTDPIEFHGLLQILGLNEFWTDFSNYEKSLHALTSGGAKPTLQEAIDLFKMISASIDGLPVESITDPQSRELLSQIIEMQGKPIAEQAMFVQRRYTEAKSLLVEVHPGHRLIIRNTKSGLERFGYRFPERKFTSPTVKLEGSLELYERMVETYLSEAYGRVESALAGGSGAGLGFAKSTYYQRLVSSLAASETSLQRRSEKLQAIQSRAAQGDISILTDLALELDDDEEIEISDDIDINLPTPAEIEGRLGSVIAAANTEVAYLGDLLAKLSSLSGGVAANDPKFQVCLQLIEQLSPENQILVFSKYTDTIDAFVEYFHSSTTADAVAGIALYTGKAVWIRQSGVTRDATKGDVTQALARNEIRIVFCSDAASEGLNLQSARIIINLDVPWNPARLEQRIGRIARLGQQAAEVEIYNLWYPRSIEARMYQRLLERREDYQVAVGEFPEIFGKAISREIGIALGDSSSATIEPTALLSEIRNSVQRRALESLWSTSGGEMSASTEFRREFLDVLTSTPLSIHDANSLSDQPGLVNSMSLNSAVLETLRFVTPAEIPSGCSSLEVVEVRGLPIALCARTDSKVVALLKTASLPAIIRAVVESTPLSREHFTTCLEHEFRDVLENNLEPWRPNIPQFNNAGPAKALEISFRSIGGIMLGKNLRGIHED